MKLTIRGLRGLEILDSRGRPTVAVRAELSSGVSAWAQVPSGASTGRHEALELRDGDTARHDGKGVLRAVASVNGELNAALSGCDPEDHAALDARMRLIDGTPDKSRLGANAMLGVSCAVARAVADSRQEPLWRYLAGFGDPTGRPPLFPVPMVNILSGGWHAGHNIEFQDFLAIPHGFATYSEALEAICAIHRHAARLLKEMGCTMTGVADEGGWGPWLETNEQALSVLARSIEAAGFRPGEQVSIALDVASSHFHQDSSYHLRTERRVLTSAGMVDLLDQWSTRYPVLSIEDGLDQDDWEGWRLLCARLGGRVQVLGDDFFTTNPARLQRGIAERSANAVLVKMNQIGTLTETFEVIDMARRNGMLAVISARSGETEDSFLADLAVASGAGQIKVGSITRSERLAKYNRLLEIEAGGDFAYPGSSVFSRLGGSAGQ